MIQEQQRYLNFGKMQISFKKGIFLLFVLFSLGATAQKRLLEKLDSNWNNSNSYLQEYQLESFKASNLSKELIDPRNVDTDLIAASIFFEINDWRTKKRRGELSQSNSLDGIAYQYVHYYKKYRFRKSIDNYFKLKRTLNKVPKYLNLDFKHMEGHVVFPSLMDYKKGKFYYHDELGMSDFHLYKGKYDRNDSTLVPEPIEQITYEQLAKNVLRELLKGKSASFLRSKAYELIAVHASLPKKRKAKKVIPKVKIVYLLGAYQNKFINEMKD